MKCISTDQLGQLCLTGKDALDLSNRIFSNRVSVAEKEQVRGSAILDHKGKALEIFWYVVKGEHQVDLYFYNERQTEMHKHIEDAIFAEDVSISVTASKGFLCYDPKADQFGFTDEMESNPMSEESWREFLISRGYPELGQLGNFVFIEAPRYESFIHEDKGCYPGQEVINKILSIGIRPRSFCVWALADKGLLQLGDELVDVQENSLGKVLWLGSLNDQNYCASFVRTKKLESLGEEVFLKVKETVLGSNGPL